MVNSGKPGFIFNVTMQNHSGYSNLDKTLLSNPASDDPLVLKYDNATTYESLMKRSDDALEYLISYFRDIEQPVIICMFGDHQPELEEEFTEKLLEKDGAAADLQARRSGHGGAGRPDGGDGAFLLAALATATIFPGREKSRFCWAAAWGCPRCICWRRSCSRRAGR